MKGRPGRNDRGKWRQKLDTAVELNMTYHSIAPIERTKCRVYGCLKERTKARYFTASSDNFIHT